MEGCAKLVAMVTSAMQTMRLLLSRRRREQHSARHQSNSPLQSGASVPSLVLLRLVVRHRLQRGRPDGGEVDLRVELLIQLPDHSSDGALPSSKQTCT